MKDSRINLRVGALLRRQITELCSTLDLSITDTISLAVERLHQQETQTMYRTIWTTEYRDGRKETYERAFPTREQASIYASEITTNGWITPYAGIIHANDLEEIKVTAIVE